VWADEFTWVYVYFQAMESDLRRKFQDAVKSEEKRYRSHRDEISKLPKADQRDALKKLKQDRSRNIALLAEQFKNTVDDHVDQQNVSSCSYSASNSTISSSYSCR